MKASTPVGSPLRKKRSFVKNPIPIEDDEDLESEIQIRRLEAINKSTEVRRKSTVLPLLAGLNANQLAQHCKDCIKLSTENKINSKNAFSFLLIDFMAAMAKKSDSEINKNFQVASCTLDASVKIYGYRVDAIHNEAIKIAGGFFGKGVDNAANDEENIDGDKSFDGENEKIKKKTKKKRKLTIVNPDTLNSKSENEALLDAAPRHNYLAKKVDGNDLLIKIPKYNDENVLMIDSDLPCWPCNNPQEPASLFACNEGCEELTSLLVDISPPKEDKLCLALSCFDLCKDTADDDLSDEEMGVSQSSSYFEFDMNASVPVEDVAMDEADPVPCQRRLLEVPLGGYDSGDDIALPSKEAMALQRQNKQIAIGDMKKKISINPLEYSMFDEKVFKSWAGPKYWKVKPLLNKKSGENKENEDNSKQVAQKRTRKGKVKGPIGLFEMTEDVVAAHLTTSEKSTLCRQTMLNWNGRNTTMPKDCKYTAKKLFTLYHMPSIVIELKVDVGDNDVEDSVGGEAVEDEEELEYCSGAIADNREDDEGEGNEDKEDMQNNSKVGAEAWDVDNMVAVPQKVDKIIVSAFKRKRHVDIKQVKRSIWNILLDPKRDSKLRLTEPLARVHEPINFTALVKNFPARFSQNTTAEPLSTPLIFNALLHLTNEKSLNLQQDKNNPTDFVISQ